MALRQLYREEEKYSTHLIQYISNDITQGLDNQGNYWPM